MIYFIRSFWLFLLVVPFSSLEAAANYLTSAQIKNLISGRDMTFYGRSGPIHFTGAAHWNKNGTITGYTNYLKAKRNWEGTWYVKDNQYCRTLTAAGRVDFKCHRVELVNAHTIRFIKEDGSVSSTSLLN